MSYKSEAIVSKLIVGETDQVRLECVSTHGCDVCGKDEKNIFFHANGSASDAVLVEKDTDFSFESKLFNIITILAVNKSKAVFTIEEDEKSKNNNTYKIISVEIVNS